MGSSSSSPQVPLHLAIVRYSCRALKVIPENHSGLEREDSGGPPRMPESTAQVSLPPLKSHPHIFIPSTTDFPSAIPQASGLFLSHSRPTRLQSPRHTGLGTISCSPHAFPVCSHSLPSESTPKQVSWPCHSGAAPGTGHFPPYSMTEEWGQRSHSPHPPPSPTPQPPPSLDPHHPLGAPSASSLPLASSKLSQAITWEPEFFWRFPLWVSCKEDHGYTLYLAAVGFWT